MKQKDIFPQSEGDAWFDRNRQTIAKRDFEHDDPIVSTIIEIATNTPDNGESLQILEVRCGSGERLAWLVIYDFFAQQPIKNEYHHKHGVYSYKMDYRLLFTGHPYYTC